MSYFCMIVHLMSLGGRQLWPEELYLDYECPLQLKDTLIHIWWSKVTAAVITVLITN